MPNKSETHLNAHVKTIAALDAFSRQWSRVGELVYAKHSHGVIQVDNDFLIVDGFPATRSQVCHFNATEKTMFTCTTNELNLGARYQTYPELFHVKRDFCKTIFPTE